MLAHNTSGGCRWYGSRMLNLSANIPLHFVAVRQIAAEGQSDRMASDMEMWMEQRYDIEFLHVEKMAPTNMHQHLLNASGGQTVYVSTQKWW